MLNNEELDRLETHWAVSAISKKTRKHCFDTIRKKQVYEALQQSIAFPDLIEESFENELSKLALAYEIPAIENIANYTNYADESCDRNLFMAAWIFQKNLIKKFFKFCVFVQWHTVVIAGTT